MPRLEVPFALQEGSAGATQNSREVLVNMFAEQANSGRSQIIRRQRPGLVRTLANTGEKRAVEKFRGVHYMVIDATLYSFDGISLTSLGTLGTSTGRCTMIDNNNGQIMVSDRVKAYYWNGSSLQQTTLPVGVVPGDLSYIGGYGAFNAVGTGKFYITGADDFSIVDDLDFATAEGSPDYLVTTFGDHSELILPGAHTTENWQNTGGTDFPLSPLVNAQMERGCGASLSLASEDNTVYFLGDDGIVYRQDGYRPSRVSTHAVETAIGEVPASIRSQAYAFTMNTRGHKFYVLTFPDYATFVFNVSTSLWHRHQTFGRNDWAVIGARNSRADYVLTPTGICTFSAGVSTDEGGIMQRLGRSAPAWNGGQKITIGAIRLDCQVGRAGAGVEPQVMLRIARDGESFGNERWRSLGETGEYLTHVVWRNCGQGERPVAEFSITDDVEFTVMTIQVDAS